MNKCLEKFASEEKPKETFAEKRAKWGKGIAEGLASAKKIVKGQATNDATGKDGNRAKWGKGITEGLASAKKTVKDQVINDTTGKARKRAKGTAALLGAAALGAGGYELNKKNNES